MNYKKTLLTTALLSGILLLLAIAASFAVNPMVERKAGQLLHRYAAQARFIERCTFSRVEFSLLSRSLTLYDVLVLYRSPKGLRTSIDRKDVCSAISTVL